MFNNRLIQLITKMASSRFHFISDELHFDLNVKELGLKLLNNVSRMPSSFPTTKTPSKVHHFLFTEVGRLEQRVSDS